MVLEFENSNGKRMVISNPRTLHDAYDDISNFLKGHNYKSYYTRTNLGEKEWEVDVGSHTEFFYISDIPDFEKEAFYAENKYR